MESPYIDIYIILHTEKIFLGKVTPIGPEKKFNYSLFNRRAAP